MKSTVFKHVIDLRPAPVYFWFLSKEPPQQLYSERENVKRRSDLACEDEESLGVRVPLNPAELIRHSVFHQVLCVLNHLVDRKKS